MNSKLSILMFAALALLIVPEVVESGESLHVRTSQPLPAVQFSAVSFSPQELPEKEETNQRFVLILNLNDQQISKLRLTGSLSTQIPPKFVNRVGAIRFKRPFSFQSDPLKVSGGKTVKRNRTVSVELDNTVLERLAYQPVDFQIYESGYDRVELRFNPLGVVAGKLPEEFEPSDEPTQSPYMYAKINSQRGIYGRLKDFEKLTIKTQFGKVDIPSEEIAGIRFNDGKSNRVFIVLKKGDVFSGQINLKSITVESRWGDQTLKLSELESLTLNREIVFLRDAINPKRWRLQSSRPVSVLVPNASTLVPNASTLVPNANLNQNSSGQVLPGQNLINPFQLNQAPPVAYPQYQAPFGSSN